MATQSPAKTPPTSNKSQADAPADTPPSSPDTPVLGQSALMRAVFGHMHHPFQVPLTFDTDKVTKVEVDRWVMVQWEAGKLRLEA